MMTLEQLFGVKSWDELRKNGGTVKANDKVTVAWEDLNLEHHLESMSFTLKRQLNMVTIHFRYLLKSINLQKNIRFAVFHHTGN